MAMLFISHDLGLVSEISDQLLVMYKGKAVEYGLSKQVLSNPQHPYTKGLLACRPIANLHLKKLPTIVDFMDVSPTGEFIAKKFDTIHQEERLGFKPLEKEQRLSEIYNKEPILKVLGLKTFFPINKGFFKRTVGYAKAVDDVSFDVYQGETLGLVGESGCGKSTLGRSILRLIEPTGGTVLFEGNNLCTISKSSMRSLRKDMQLIFQDPYSSLNPHMTIGQAIIEPMQVHNIGKDNTERRLKVIQLLERVGLKAEHYNRYPHEFSGGQRQRISIARALSMNPKFIICDESVSALDVSVQSQVLNLLIDLREEFGLTYIFISHDLSVVRFISDRIIVMNKGRIEEIGTAEQIY
jgi:peptide/nickel transport system ATP-binding protein